MLEEAAGITGLHARRHEAELKLRAAEANLARAEDLRGQLEGQLESLKRQARQASRYRNISGAIRAAEAELLAIQRATRRSGRGPPRARRCTTPGWRWPPPPRRPPRPPPAPPRPPPRCPALRAAEGEARTALERHRLAGEQIAAEEARAARGAGRPPGSGCSSWPRPRPCRAAARATPPRRRPGWPRKPRASPPRRRRIRRAWQSAEADAAEAATAVRAAEAAANRATEHAAELRRGIGR